MIKSSQAKSMEPKLRKMRVVRLPPSQQHFSRTLHTYMPQTNRGSLYITLQYILIDTIAMVAITQVSEQHANFKYRPRSKYCCNKLIYYFSRILSLAYSSTQERRDTNETNSEVTLPLDRVLITKCSGYFLSSVSRPNHGLPLLSLCSQSSEVRYLLTLL